MCWRLEYLEDLTLRSNSFRSVEVDSVGSSSSFHAFHSHSQLFLLLPTTITPATSRSPRLEVMQCAKQLDKAHARNEFTHLSGQI